METAARVLHRHRAMSMLSPSRQLITPIARTRRAAIQPRQADVHHREKIARVIEQLWLRDGTAPVSLRKKAVSHQVPKRNDKRHTDEKIDVSDLDEILEIDPVNMTCTAEPGVTFVDLVEATLRHGLVPLVVPELKTITIGGAVAGCSLESMSFKYGGFHDTCLEYEVITASGDVLHCTPENEHALIFQMMHGSFGTLGILSRLKFRLVRAKPYVHVAYDTYSTLDAYKEAIWERFEKRDVDFMDGIIHSPNQYVLCIGNFIDEAPYTNRYDWLKVYYRSTAKRKHDYLRTQDYFFRYDNGVTNPTPRSFVGRLLLGKIMGSDRLLRLATKARRLISAERPQVTLDTFLPFSKMDAFLEWYTAQIGHYPLWCVPYKRVRDYEWLSKSFFANIDDRLFVDLAIYGMKQPRGRNVYKEIEEALPRFNGTKTLISYNYYDEKTFWRALNEENYRAVKKITDPSNVFRDLYAKTCRAALGKE